jgi:hypothetical protein
MVNFKMFLSGFAKVLAAILGTPKVCRTIRRTRRKIGRNEPCGCGKMTGTFLIDKHCNQVNIPVKYKNCHWATHEAKGMR